MKPEEAIPLLQRGLVGEIYDTKGYLTALGYEALDAIDSSNCPTLVQKKHGEWIFNKDGNYECSECGIAWKDMPVKDAKPVFKACPWCGADMRKEGKSSDKALDNR